MSSTRVGGRKAHFAEKIQGDRKEVIELLQYHRYQTDIYGTVGER